MKKEMWNSLSIKEKKMRLSQKEKKKEKKRESTEV